MFVKKKSKLIISGNNAHNYRNKYVCSNNVPGTYKNVSI